MNSSVLIALVVLATCLCASESVRMRHFLNPQRYRVNLLSEVSDNCKNISFISQYVSALLLPSGQNERICFKLKLLFPCELESLTISTMTNATKRTHTRCAIS